MKPTEEQIKRFWEWCGFKFVENIEHSQYFGDLDFSSWIYPDSGYRARDLPPLDLNNLFKYAVPKVIKKMDTEGKVIFPILSLWGKWYDEIIALAGTSLTDDYEIITLALFWAIYKVIEVA